MKLKYEREKGERGYNFQCFDCTWDVWVIADVGEEITSDKAWEFIKAQGWYYGTGWICPDCIDDDDRRFSHLHHEYD